jgi:hypothetical protein
MLEFRRVRIEIVPISEAEVGRFSYRDVNISNLILDGEMRLSDDEVAELDKSIGVETYPAGIRASGAPFNDWFDLIKAVTKDTPESRTLIRFLEDNAYPAILRKKTIGFDEQGNSKIEDAPYVLSNSELQDFMIDNVSAASILREVGINISDIGRKSDDELVAEYLPAFKEIEEPTEDEEDEEDEVALAHEIKSKKEDPETTLRDAINRAKRPDFGEQFELPADYNRWWFDQLRRYVPRAKKPESGGQIVFGGKRALRGAIGSPTELSIRRQGIAKHIIDNSQPQVIEELGSIFSVIPDDWSDTLLGANGSNVNITIPTNKKGDPPSQLARRESGISTVDYEALQRLYRIMNMLKDRSETALQNNNLKLLGQYQQSIEEITNKIKNIEDSATPTYKVFFSVKLPLTHFLDKIRQEIGETGIKKAEDIDPTMKGVGVSSQMVAQTSLTGLPRLVILLDPASASFIPGGGGPAVPGGSQRFAKLPHKVHPEEEDTIVNWDPIDFRRKKVIRTPSGEVKTGISYSPGILNFREDLYDLINDQVGYVVDSPTKLIRIDNNGNIIFRMQKSGGYAPESDEESDPDIGVRLKVSQKVKEELPKELRKAGEEIKIGEKTEKQRTKDRLKTLRSKIKAGKYYTGEPESKPTSEPEQTKKRDWLGDILKSIESEED